MDDVERAGLERGQREVAVSLGHAHHDHARALATGERRQGLEAVEVRHHQVQRDDVGIQLLDLGERVQSVARRPHHLDARCGLARHAWTLRAKAESSTTSTRIVMDPFDRRTRRGALRHWKAVPSRIKDSRRSDQEAAVEGEGLGAAAPRTRVEVSSRK